MAILIEHTAEANASIVPIIIKVDRHTLYKRRWRATAENGTELAVNLPAPVPEGTILTSANDEHYLIQQTTEDVLVISLPTSTQLAAQVGWYLGNQHLPVEIRPDAIILEKLDTLAASLDRIGIPYTFKHDVFRCRMHSHQH
ncbi:MAG: urease accessory protein UreE [Akkermansiaceae bacterium]